MAVHARRRFLPFRKGGDPYLAFAKQAPGAVPSDATKDSHPYGAATVV